MKPALKYLLIVCALLVLWITADYLWPVSNSIYQFNPKAVATSDANMWRSYYAKEPAKMFFQFASLMREQFHAPFFRSFIIAFYGGKAAFVFKKSKSRSDYEKALPWLVKYYTELHRLSKEDFNILQASQTELEWWIVHRDRRHYTYNDLEVALQKNASAIYQKPDSAFEEYALYRTQAMAIRDEKDATRVVTENDWKTIENDLQHSWTALHKAVTYQQALAKSRKLANKNHY
jgi:hypothetical protein